MGTYQEFLESKSIRSACVGIDPPASLMAGMFGFQDKIVRWALAKGRAAIFADCGMGKTLMQLEWARHVPGNVIILAPLAVASQTAAEAAKFGIVAGVSNDGTPKGKITITNYQKLHKFTMSDYAGIVLDESSILKSYDGKTRAAIIEASQSIPYRLACTATPAPNDHMELGNHAEFIGAMTRAEMLATFFVHDGGETNKWRLKGHAVDDFWRWMATWAVAIKKPSDVGDYDAGGVASFDLPDLHVTAHTVDSDYAQDGVLFPVAMSLTDLRAARKASMANRVRVIADMANASDEQWLVWCDLNAEGDALASAIPDAVQISGSDTDENKVLRMNAFTDGAIRVLVTKPQIAGFGMNWQNCRNVAFVGLTHSYERFYQAVRRCWRFGQTLPVNVHIALSDAEMTVLDSIKRKQADADAMAASMVGHMCSMDDWGGMSMSHDEYTETSDHGDGWDIYNGDCVEGLARMDDCTIDYSIFSPPFASLYTYSNSARDMGNCSDHGVFFEQFRYLIDHLYRVTKPGRLLSFHCMNLPTSKARNGYIGLTDFRGDLIRSFVDAGWIYHSEVCIWKDPVTAMQRTKALGLLHKQLKKDSCMSRQGIADYLVTMRKPGENPDRVTHTNESFPVHVWQQYASPVWMDITPSNTLQHRSAREHNDERHICPLQLEVIERAMRLWTRPGDLVLSPFAGIGSEGHVAINEGRKFVGYELKKSYYDQARANLRAASSEPAQRQLFAP